MSNPKPAYRPGRFFLLATTTLTAAFVVAATGCAGGNAQRDASHAGGAGAGMGTGGSGGGAGAGSGGAQPTEIRALAPLPIPPGPDDVPPPSGVPGNLRVLDWAGFTSALTYTFDDAQPSQIEHYAELQATGVRMTFFITSGSRSSSASFDATFTQAVADGHEMGNHTVHHCHADLSGCSNGSATSLDAELDECNGYIASQFGQGAVFTAATPYGDTAYAAAEATRFFLNRGVSGGTVGPNDSSDPFNLPCHAAVAGETLDSFDAAIDSAQSGGRWLIFLIHTINPTTANWYAPIDVSLVTESVAHAQSLETMWIDSMVNVGAYWRGQQLLSSVTPTSVGDEQTFTWTLPPNFPPGRQLRVTVDGGTPWQDGATVPWDPRGYYEIALDSGSLTLSP